MDAPRDGCGVCLGQSLGQWLRAGSRPPSGAVWVSALEDSELLPRCDNLEADRVARADFQALSGSGYAG